MAVWASGVWASGVWADNVWFGMGGGAEPEPEVVVTQAGGTSKRKRKRVIHYSDFASREEFQKALRAQIRETVSVREAPQRIALAESMAASLIQQADAQIQTSHKVLDDIQKMKDDEDKMLQVLLSL